MAKVLQLCSYINLKKLFIMAKVNGIIKIEGTVEDLTFYKKDGQNFVRKKGGISKERIMSDPNFVRTRENGNEFGHSGSSGKLLKLAVGPMVFKAKDSKLSSRLLQTMSRIKNLDTVSARGERKVGVGITTTEGKLQLKGFDFNPKAPLKGVLFVPLTLDTADGSVFISDFIPTEQVQYPQGATHMSFQSAAVLVDFETGISEAVYSSTENIPIGLTSTTVTLTPASVPIGTGTQLFLLLISFYQEVNGIQYSLKNEEFNVLHILDVV
jgi:hypothetical protein